MPQASATSGRKVPDHLRAFHQPRHVAAGQTGGGQHGVRPVPAPRRRATRFRRCRTSPTPPRRSSAAARSPWAATPWRPWRTTSGSCAATHSSFGAVKPGMARLPVIAREPRLAAFQLDAFGPRCARRSTGWRGAGPGLRRRAGWRRASVRTGPIPVTAATSAGWAARKARTARSTAAHQDSGSCSDHKGWGRWTVRDSVDSATMSWASSTRTALTPEVPISNPTYITRPLPLGQHQRWPR